MTQIPPLSPADQLIETARFCTAQADLALEAAGAAAWLCVGATSLAQQAAALALKAADDAIPAQAGAAELLLRAASKDRLPPPYTLPFSSGARRDFDRLVETRNSFMHPRGVTWHVSPQTLGRGLPVVVASVRHLVLVQPISRDLIPVSNQTGLSDSLSALTALAEFLTD